MTLLADLTDFLHSHRPHGPLTADATPPAWNGYLVQFASLNWVHAARHEVLDE